MGIRTVAQAFDGNGLELMLYQNGKAGTATKKRMRPEYEPVRIHLGRD